MITLYSFAKRLNVVDASPFVVKVDLFMRMADIAYTVKSGVKYLKIAPKGKLPFIDHDGTFIADSSDILTYLTDKFDLTIDSDLNAAQKAQAYLITKSLDENLYWYLVYSRWAMDEHWPMIKKAFFGAIPAPMAWFIPNIIRNKVKKNLNGQGVGRHSSDEVLAMTDKTFAALSEMLGDQDYFYGDKYTSLDATVYAHLCEFISVQYEDGIDNEFTKAAKKHQNLVQYCQRIEAQFYPEK
jgi:glutathione S-transferase